MSTFKVKLTPLTPISISHPEVPPPVESKRDIIPMTTPTNTQTPDLSALLDWQFDALLSLLPPTHEELNTMFPPDFPVFSSFTAPPEHGFPDLQSEDYDALVGAFCADAQPLSLALPQELAAELWEFKQSMGESLFSKSEFLPEVQETRFVQSGFEEFAAFGIDLDEPPQNPSE